MLRSRVDRTLGKSIAAAGRQRLPCLRQASSRASQMNEAHEAVSVQDLQDRSIWSEVVATYEAAKRSGAATQTQTKASLLHCPDVGVDFVIRLATALNAKPKAPSESGTEAKKVWHNPFDPPERALTVGYLGPGHTLVLNKFNVVAHHCLVITRTFQSQADPLHGPDLEAARRVVHAMPHGGVAFYNCGPLSGRSQPHKHLQVVPLPFCEEGPEQQPPVIPIQNLLIGAEAEAGRTHGAATLAPLTPHPFPVKTLPFRCYAARLPPGATPTQLEGAAHDLLVMAFPEAALPRHPSQRYNNTSALQDAAGATVAAAASATAAGSVGPAASPGTAADAVRSASPTGSAPGHLRRTSGSTDVFEEDDVDLEGREAVVHAIKSARLSYNVLLTRDLLVYVPRSAETCGPCAINSLGFAGTLLVKSEEEAEYVRKTGPLAMLAAVGVPW